MVLYVLLELLILEKLNVNVLRVIIVDLVIKKENVLPGPIKIQK